MNRTKRKIFETSMKLFSEKGYDATSIEEITAVVGQPGKDNDWLNIPPGGYDLPFK